MEKEMPKEQLDFRKGSRTCDHLANIKWIMKTRKYMKEIYLFFVEQKKIIVKAISEY